MEDFTNQRLLLHSGCKKIRKTVVLASFFDPPVSSSLPHSPHPLLINEDLAPVSSDRRILSAWDMTFLWLGLVVSVPNYYLAGSLVEIGMSWYQGIGCVVVANLITYLILVLAGHPGTKYGISFPVLLRASFGIFGANVPAALRSFVACGWFGIETWIGGQAIFQLLNSMIGGGWLTKLASSMTFLGTTVPELFCFLSFWLLQIWIIWNGIESIKKLESYSAPVLVTLTLALLTWAYFTAGGWGPMLAAPSLFERGGSKAGQFWKVFLPALTANVGTWATLSLNIPDFTRYTKSQSDQVIGQASMPLFMASFAFVGLAVTSATEVIYGEAISNPINVLVRIGGILPTTLALVGVILATLTTNIAANVVATTNSLINLNPKFFSYRIAGLTAGFLSMCFLPWKLLESSHGFIYTWLLGYSALLGPIGGIVLTDYYIVRGTCLDLESLYTTNQAGCYCYSKGVNIGAMIALVAGIMPSIPGFLLTVGVLKKTPGLIPNLLLAAYDGAWFVGFLVAGLVYWISTRFQNKPAPRL